MQRNRKRRRGIVPLRNLDLGQGKPLKYIPQGGLIDCFSARLLLSSDLLVLETGLISPKSRMAGSLEH
jgi:hypothetical protein